MTRPEGEGIPLLPTDATTKQLLGEILARIGGLSLVTDDAGTPPYRLAGILCQNPGLAARLFAHAGRLIGSGRYPWKFIKALLRGQAHTVGVGMHNFMDAAQVAAAPGDPVVKARLDSCVFKGAVKNGAGEWEAAPMCSMNRQRWSDLYEGRLRDPELLAQPQPVSSAATVAAVGAEAGRASV